MIASLLVADIGPRAATLRSPKPGKVPGLRSATIGLTAPLGGGRIPRPQIGRAMFVSFWDDEAALNAYLADSRLAAHFADGFRMRMKPVRAHGTWPGLPDDIPRSRKVETEGPTAVITIAREFFDVPVDPIDELKEDAKILDEHGGIQAFLEVKGTNSGIKREHINQVDSHRERSRVAARVKALFNDAQSFIAVQFDNGLLQVLGHACLLHLLKMLG